MAVEPHDVRQRDQARSRRDLGEDRGQRFGCRPLHHPGLLDPGTRRKQRHEKSGMLGIGRHDLVLRRQTQGGDDEVAALGRRGGQDEFVGCDVDELAKPLAEARLEGGGRFPDLCAAPPLLQRGPNA